MGSSSSSRASTQALRAEARHLGQLAVAAGVIADVDVAAVFALVDVAAEGGGAAGLDGVQGAALLEAGVVLGAVGVGEGAHDVGEFELGRAVFGRALAADLGGAEGTAHGSSIAGFRKLAGDVGF